MTTFVFRLKAARPMLAVEINDQERPSDAMPVIVAELLLALQVGQQKIYS